ncbi:MAG: metal ABC transporter substrate-binding protein [Planctomycetota bacterium]
MKITILLFALGLSVSIRPAAPASAPEKLKVVATISDLADIAGKIGGDRVTITTLAKGTQNIHRVQFRPTHLVRTGEADLFLQMGLSLEHSYVPELLLAARNPQIRPGAPGFVNCSEGWEPVEVPAEISRRDAADVHPQGNPHFNLDPAAGGFLADRILEGLIRVDPDSADYYRERRAAYETELAAARERWAPLVEKLRGRKVVIYHQDFSYFARATGMTIAGTFEPKIGVPPTPTDLARLIELIRREGVTLLLTAKWSNNRSVHFVAEKTGAEILEVPVMVEGVAHTDSWIAMMDFLFAEIVKHFAAR